MAVITGADLISRLSAKFADDNSDEVLSILEDVEDTFSDFESKISEDWKTKYEENDKSWSEKYKENDKSWREKYKARFEGKPLEDTIVNEYDEETEKKTFEDLFK